MNTHRLTSAAIIALLGLVAGPCAAQSTHFDVEVGYQTVNVDGDENLYRTQINQDDGFVLRGLSINHIDPTGEAGFVDNFRIDAAGFGGNPAGTFRLRTLEDMREPSWHPAACLDSYLLTDAKVVEGWPLRPAPCCPG